MERCWPGSGEAVKELARAVHSRTSRPICALAVMTSLPLKNHAPGIQLTLLNGTDTVTVMGSLGPTEFKSLGLHVAVAPGIEQLDV